MLYAVSKQNQATIDSPTKPHSNGMSLMPDCFLAGSVIPNILMKWGKGVNLIFHEGLESYNHCGWLRGDTLAACLDRGLSDSTVWEQISSPTLQYNNMIFEDR